MTDLRSTMRTWLAPDGPRSAILVRVLVGGVFLPEGIKKLLFPDAWGAGRFERIGILWPHLTGPFVGVVEIVCGALILAGVASRLAAIPLLIDIAVAIAKTKLPLLWRATAVSTKVGFWSMQAESRTDFAMLLGLLFLLFAGSGRYSIDAHIAGE